MKTLAVLTRDDIRSLEIAINKTTCAQQALRANAIPANAPKTAADKYFREAMFACADAQYLQEYFWRDLARRYGVEQTRLRVDFNTSKLFINE
ncbi:hypothetical protein NO1_0698 [Candidatus Termititenax aidoneus]|uniref:Uncharacterized protein n=1 Tax=Termititenax aidoneus TaxID=2218524 RepID=A0A388T9J5_TERA1|nr:hypothetical protein NO1_0698 [Candidatus Termititenax aidoneus]